MTPTRKATGWRGWASRIFLLDHYPSLPVLHSWILSKGLALWKLETIMCVHYYLCSLILEKFSRNFFPQQKSWAMTEHRNLLKCSSTEKFSIQEERSVLNIRQNLELFNQRDGECSSVQSRQNKYLPGLKRGQSILASHKGMNFSEFTSKMILFLLVNLWIKMKGPM